MRNPKTKDREAREQASENYRVRELLEPCRRCGAVSGDLCSVDYGGKTIAKRVPHPERIADAKPLL